MVIIAAALIVFIKNSSASQGIPVEVSLVERMDTKRQMHSNSCGLSDANNQIRI